LTDKRRANERGKDRRSKQSEGEGRPERPEGEKEGETRSAVSEPSSEQRVSVKAVKGAGKEKEDFLPAQALTVIPLKEFKACDGKNTLFRWAARRSRRPCRSSVLPLTAGAFSLRYNGKS